MRAKPNSYNISNNAEQFSNDAEASEWAISRILASEPAEPIGKVFFLISSECSASQKPIPH
jgi:hypothetical protein